MAAGGDINFAADDGLHAAGGGLVVKIGGGEEISVIGDGDGGHAAARGFIDEFADIAGPVEQRKIGVQMKMYEVRVSHAGIYSKPLCNTSLFVALAGGRDKDACDTLNAALLIFWALTSLPVCDVPLAFSQARDARLAPRPLQEPTYRFWLQRPALPASLRPSLRPFLCSWAFSFLPSSARP